MAATFKAFGVIAWAVFGIAGAARAGHHDIDGDGRADVVWRNTSTGANVIWLHASAAAPRLVARVTDARWAIVGEGDFDGDGRADLFWRNLGTGANVIWRSGDAAQPIATTAVTDLRWLVAGIADFDGDGRDDVLWRHMATGSNAIWRSGNAATRRTVVAVTDLHWVVAGVGDFDGDRHADIFWRNLATGGNAIWRAGNAATQQPVAAVTDAAWQVAAIGDFDGDGVDDVFWRDLDGRDALWRRADRGSQVGVPWVGEIAWQVAGSGDFDGDGRSDLLWREFWHGTNVVWRGADARTRMAVTGVANLDWAVVPFAAQPTRPLLSVAEQVAVPEGNSGSRAVSFPIRLSHPSVLPVAYQYFTASDSFTAEDGATGATPGSDYAETAGARTIAPGRLADAVGVVVSGDTMPEPHESFDVIVHDPTGAQLLWVDGLGVIRNDDGTTLWIHDSSASEGDSGHRFLTLTVWLSAPLASPVRVHAATAPDRSAGVFAATAGVDYVSKQEDLAIPAGATSTTFTVEIIGDEIVEPLAEQFLVNLSNVQGDAILIPTSAVCAIVDDDGTFPFP